MEWTQAEMNDYIKQIVKDVNKNKSAHYLISQQGGQYGSTIHYIYRCKETGKDVMSSTPKTTNCEHCGKPIVE